MLVANKKTNCQKIDEPLGTRIIRNQVNATNLNSTPENLGSGMKVAIRNLNAKANSTPFSPSFQEKLVTAITNAVMAVIGDLFASMQETLDAQAVKIDSLKTYTRRSSCSQAKKINNLEQYIRRNSPHGIPKTENDTEESTDEIVISK